MKPNMELCVGFDKAKGVWRYQRDNSNMTSLFRFANKRAINQMVKPH
jgi:hypothetical protein